MNDKRIYPHFLNLLKIYLPIYLLAGIVFYLMVGVKFPPTLIHYLVVVGWTILTAGYLIFGSKNSYYTLTKHEIIHHKGAHKLYYAYKDIIYIDTTYSERKGSIRFVTSKGDERYLMHDKEHLVYKEMLAKVANLKTREEINRLFPTLKL